MNRDSLHVCAFDRFPPSMSQNEKAGRVDKVLGELGLTGVKDTIAGGISNGHEVRGLSGGERKRLSVGIELLHEPAILLLDEVPSCRSAHLTPATAHVRSRQLPGPERHDPHGALRTAARPDGASVDPPAEIVDLCFARSDRVAHQGQRRLSGHSGRSQRVLRT